MTKRREMVENGDDKQRTEYAEICKSIKKQAREDVHKEMQPKDHTGNDHDIK